MNLSISSRNLSEMQDQGFTVFEDVLSLHELDSLDEALVDFLERTRRDDRTREVDFGQKVAERDDFVRDFAKRTEFVTLATAFIGPDTDLYFNQMVYKNPEGAIPFSWHQDDAYGPVEPSPYLTVWIPITDATLENGCLSVMPGSSRQGLVPHWESDFGLACHSNDDPDQGVLLPLKQGSLCAFWSTTMHKSGANLTTAVRKAFILQFCPVGMRHKASGMTIRSRIPISRNGEPVR
ncbi:MAG: phytanoyl-CoA dioxygenase family protein [Chlorobia bacterium]|nr:phytanoyl-CoA dioxygenase family protein [Fimbriimonadaceae bacterium]